MQKNGRLPHLAIAAAALLAFGCTSSSSQESMGATLAVDDADADAYELAGRVSLPSTSPEELPGLHNVCHLSESVISGSEPQGEEAFRHLSELGVRTILSVDGKVPDQELAAKYGMRYVHAPIRYNGIEDEELLQIAKTFRELDGPFYVHCFHGKHRGPAAAAVGRIVIDGAERVRAVAEMRQWCGTSKKYKGLYETLAAHPIPGPEETAAYDWDFPADKPMRGLRSAMVDLARHFDMLEIAVLNDFEYDAEHPDVDAHNESLILRDLFEASLELDEIDQHPAEFRASLEDSFQASVRITELLRDLGEVQLQPSARDAALEAFEVIDQNCATCHKSYRNQKR